MIIRNATIDDIPAMTDVQLDGWRTTYRGIVPDAFLDGLSYEDRAARWKQTFENNDRQNGVFVAEDAAGHIVGMASGGCEREGTHGLEGELYALYVRKEAQGRGAGRMLLRAVARMLHERGMKDMLIWVLAANPSRGFYQACGGTEVTRKMIEIGGAELEEIGYAWHDLLALL